MSSNTPFPADRTVVLTGAASARGIGRAAADRMASEGWSIAILDINAEDAKAAAAEIGSSRAVKAIGVGADVSDEASVDRAITEIEQSLPPIVGLVNLAGISSPTPFMEPTVEEWDNVFAINMHGTFSQVAYSASKAGILGFTRALAREVGEHNITVNAIAPGPIDTDIMGGTLTDERKAQMSADILLGRVGTVQEVAALLCFLMSEDAGYITAATYDINGGLQIS